MKHSCDCDFAGGVPEKVMHLFVIEHAPQHLNEEEDVDNSQ